MAKTHQSSSIRAVASRRVQAEIEPKVWSWARQNLGEDAIRAAWEDFALQRYRIEPEGAEVQLFEPWFLYSWRVRLPGARKRPLGSGSGLSIAELFIRWHAPELSVEQRDFLKAVISEPFSYYDVEGCEPGRSLQLRDILRCVQREVVEVSGSQGPRPGDILYCRTVSFESANLIIGSGALVIPPEHKGAFLELRRSLREEVGSIDSASLQAVDDELREIYFITRDQLVNPPAPKLCNSDGDPLLFHEIRYEVESPDVAFHALSSLAAGDTVHELRRQARLDRSGAVRKVEFSWVRCGNTMNPGLENTILGHVRIDGRRLTVEVNSERRAKRIMSEVKRRLKGGAVHLETRARSADAALRSPQRGRAQPAGRPRSLGSGDLRRHPEVQAKIRSMLEAHWRDWPGHPLPALGGKTPLDAVKDSEGREMVEALLIAAERDERDNPQAGEPIDFTPIRRRLGLRPPRSS